MSLLDPESYLCTPASEATPFRQTLPQIASARRPPSGGASARRAATSPLAATAPAATGREDEHDDDASGGGGGGFEAEGAGGGGGGSSSRASSCGPALPSARSHGVEDHRVDPALRVALDRLDAVRQRQPSMEDFSLEHFLGRQARRQSSLGTASAAEVEMSWEQQQQQDVTEEDVTALEAAVDAYLAQTTSLATAPTAQSLDCGTQQHGVRPVFSTDLLLAAVLSSTPSTGSRPPWPATELSRSTSPGSTQQSSLSSVGAFSSADSGLSERSGRRPPRGSTGPRPRDGGEAYTAAGAASGASAAAAGAPVGALSARARTSESPSGPRAPLSAR
eukprot:CAMPEP_0177552590 /NCGR_PEP_ID=MMETSP0369-20130122/66916_1 /TAXON_ID=447022 ORGANISM="Scrippsiella hangoei-like, Strain SHHI-4" /NCGR_SAMPLE_ID=MMETSP0369 /ASSEMBLY_ACC=CAM_ASM_000364 /LENGTH=333 /DNA_ID=CAMNT_0019038327 /DNA_START=74 /DNA_END=1074 /DNA_ORIENTATION=-